MTSKISAWPSIGSTTRATRFWTGKRSSVGYSIKIKASAARALQRVDPGDRKRLVEAIGRLADEAAAGAALKGEFGGLRRLRVGRYRIIYETLHRELTVLVIRIGHRREVYR
jgi:mRNA interferase RelE/StbE